MATMRMVEAIGTDALYCMSRDHALLVALGREEIDMHAVVPNIKTHDTIAWVVQDGIVGW